MEPQSKTFRQENNFLLYLRTQKLQIKLFKK